MKKSKMTWSRALVGSAIVLALLLTGCPSGGDDEKETEDQKSTVSGGSLAERFDAPETGATPDLAFTADPYDGAIVWKSGTVVHHGAFEGNAVYTAEVTLTAKGNYTFTGFDGTFTHGSVNGTKGSNTGTALVVSFVFPATAAEQGTPATKVTDLDLSSKVPAPVWTETAVTAFGGDDDDDEDAQYTGAVSWNPAIPANGKFAAGQVYTATVTLTANEGYTFTGVAADSFTHGSLTVTSPAASGIVATVTIVFTATGSDPAEVTDLALDGKFNTPVVGDTASTAFAKGEDAQYDGTVAWQSGTPLTDFAGVFATNQSYTAVLTLTAEEGYTFELSEGTLTFTFSGAASVTAGTVSGDGATVTVTVVFTKPLETDDASISAGFGYAEIPVTLGGDPLSESEEIVIAQSNNGSAVLGVAAASGYEDILWYAQGAAGVADTLTVKAKELLVKKHSVTVTATKDGVFYSRTIPFEVVEEEPVS
jgi:hypothetical protein